MSLTPLEKEELISRCAALLRERGEFAGRGPSHDSIALKAGFGDYMIRSSMNEDPEKPYPVHMELKRLFPTVNHSPLESAIFIADITVDGIKQKWIEQQWSPIDDATKALTAIRIAMVLDDLADVADDA